MTLEPEAIPADVEMKDVQVKALEWQPTASGYGVEAYSIIGKYWVRDGQFWAPGCTVSKPYRTDEDAKAAAQADFEQRIRSALTSPEAPQASEVVRELAEALEWYGEQSRLCRLIHSGGDAGRHALAADGGKRAKATLAKIGGDHE